MVVEVLETIELFHAFTTFDVALAILLQTLNY